MNHRWLRARLRSAGRVAWVLGGFPRLTRPGLFCADRRGLAARRTRHSRGHFSALSWPVRRCVMVSTVVRDCAPGEQGCAGVAQWCVMDA